MGTASVPAYISRPNWFKFSGHARGLGCTFHFGQCLITAMRDIGLKPLYVEGRQQPEAETTELILPLGHACKGHGFLAN